MIVFSDLMSVFSDLILFSQPSHAEHDLGPPLIKHVLQQQAQESQAYNMTGLGIPGLHMTEIGTAGLKIMQL